MLMSREEVIHWALNEHETKGISVEDFDHIVHCLHDICLWYDEGRPLGDFLTAVLKNNFMEARGRADDVNGKVLHLYAKFIYNNLPMDYKQRIRSRHPTSGRSENERRSEP